jgi:hypothetical protein
MKAERMSCEEAITSARPRSEAFVDAVGDGWSEEARFTARKDGVVPLVIGVAEGVGTFSIR